MKTCNALVFFLISLVLLSCNKERSIQEYYVENQENSKFIAVDIPTSLLANSENLDEQQRATLETVRKINLLALPVEEGQETYESEKADLRKILENDQYQLLMKYGSGERKAEIYFTGDEEAIDEFILFGFDDQRGLGLARILGEDMNPEKLLKLLSSLKHGDINLSGLSEVAGMFKKKILQEKTGDTIGGNQEEPNQE